MRRRNSEGEDPEPSLFDLPLDIPDRDRLPSEAPEETDFELEEMAPPPRPRG